METFMQNFTKVPEIVAKTTYGLLYQDFRSSLSRITFCSVVPVVVNLRHLGSRVLKEFNNCTLVVGN